MTMARKDSLRDYYSHAIAAHIDGDERLFVPIDPAIAALIDSIAKTTGAAAIDLGYGAGTYAIAMARAGLTVTAVDMINPHLLQQRLNDQPQLLDRLNILEADLATYRPDKPYRLAIAKDVLHFLPRQTIELMLNQLIAMAPSGAVHVMTMFTDISRYDRTGAPTQIDGEASYSRTEWERELNRLYSGWQNEFDIRDHEQYESAERGGRKYFQAQLIRLIARKP